MATSDSVFSSFDHCSTLSRANWIVYSEDPKGAPRYGRPVLTTLTLVPAKAAVALDRHCQESLVCNQRTKWLVPSMSIIRSFYRIEFKYTGECAEGNVKSDEKFPLLSVIVLTTSTVN